MDDKQWTLWVFAGPGALSGLISVDKGLGLVTAKAGQPSPLAAALARAVGNAAVLPKVTIVAETVDEPTLLEQLTGNWSSSRFLVEPASEPANLQPDKEPGQRDLQAFVTWASEQTSKLHPEGSRRALIVLGDLLWAIGDELASPFGPTAGYRPTYPSKVVIKKGSTSSTYDRDAAGLTYSGISTEELLRRASQTDVTSVEGSLPQPMADDLNLTALVALKKYTGDGDTNSDRSLGAAAEGSTHEQTTRRVDALVAALHDSSGAVIEVDLLATDARDLGQLTALRRLAPHATFFVAGSASELADSPLVDLIEALADKPTCSPEALAEAAVERGHARAKLIGRRSQKLIDRDGGNATLRARARLLLDDGWDALALRSSGVPAILACLDALAVAALAKLDPREITMLVAELQHGLASPRRELGPLLARLNALDDEPGLRAAIDRLTDAIKDARVERRELGDQPPTLGLGHDGSDAASPWTALLTVLGQGPRLVSKLEQRTLADIQTFTSRSTALPRAQRPKSEPFAWLVYAPTIAAHDDFDPRTNFAAFLAEKLEEHVGVRHFGLIVRGATTLARPASLLLAGSTGEFLSISTLAGCLRAALAKHGRDPLALLVLDDPALLSLEVAYELREVTHVLVTTADQDPISVEIKLDALACERAAVDDLADGSAVLEPSVSVWRRSVARNLATALVEHGNLQAINLQYVETLCRRVDRVCQLMLDHLDNPGVLAGLAVGFVRGNLIDVLNFAQMGQKGDGQEPMKGLRDHWYPARAWYSDAARTIDFAMGDVYNWIREPGYDRDSGGAPLWIKDPIVKREDDERIYARRLLIDVESKRPRDYRELAFHQDVRLHPLLAAWRLLCPPGGCAVPQLWPLIALGLTHAPSEASRAELSRLTGDDQAADFFTAFGPPPLISLDIENAASEAGGYALSLSSSESAAVLVRQHTNVDLAANGGGFDGLGFLVARGRVSNQAWHLLQSLGSSLAEDLGWELLKALERERLAVLETGRSSDVHLALALPRALLRLPWELMSLPALASGRPRELVAERYAVGRQMWSDCERRRIRRDDPIRMLIVGAPQTAGPALPGARLEAEQLAKLCEEIAVDLASEFDFRRERDVFIGTDLSREALRALLREGLYDIVHFAGHGTFDSRAPERSGWLVSDGLLTAIELHNTLAASETPPWLIFANACNTGMTAGGPEARHGEVYGIAETCIRDGVNAFIAPLWPIHDESARVLATEFYRRLLLQRATVGVALQRARVATRKVWETTREGTSDISWAGMVLFGNPTERLNETASS